MFPNHALYRVFTYGSGQAREKPVGSHQNNCSMDVFWTQLWHTVFWSPRYAHPQKNLHLNKSVPDLVGKWAEDRAFLRIFSTKPWIDGQTSPKTNSLKPEYGWFPPWNLRSPWNLIFLVYQAYERAHGSKRQCGTKSCDILTRWWTKQKSHLIFTAFHNVLPFVPKGCKMACPSRVGVWWVFSVQTQVSLL